jgi:FkbM family methyltransferase
MPVIEEIAPPTDIERLSPAGLLDLLRGAHGDAGAARLLIDCLQGLGTLPAGASDPTRDNAGHRGADPARFGNFWRDCRAALAAYRGSLPAGARPVMLDLGGGRGEIAGLREGFEYVLVDVAPADPAADRAIRHDLSEPLPLPEDSVDVVFSNQVLEHLRFPWLLPPEIRRVLKPGGLCMVSTVFAYRYHPYPEDYWRFTTAALRLLMDDLGGLQQDLARYELTHRRDDRRGTRADGHDAPPIDWLGGFRENWFAYYIGRKRVPPKPAAPAAGVNEVALPRAPARIRGSSAYAARTTAESIRPLLLACSKLLHEGSTCIDIGANIGVTALAMARHATAGRVFAYEPHPATFAELEANLAADPFGAVVRAERVALGEAPGSVAFRDVPLHASGNAVLPEGGLASEIFPSIEVERRRLDACTPWSEGAAADLVKIDVEGRELEVLRGAPALFAASRAVLVEFNPWCLSLYATTLPEAALQEICAQFRFVLAHGPRGFVPLNGARERFRFLEETMLRGRVGELLCTQHADVAALFQESGRQGEAS